MAKVFVCNVDVLHNPSMFSSKFELEVTFECIEELPDDLEWKIIYVGSAESEEFDQVLDTVFVGPVPEGRHKFVFEADSPDPSKIPSSDVVGVTVILLTCSYREQEFIRIGYYVSNEYDDPELVENPPPTPILEKLNRNILASNPRVTKFKINWDNTTQNGNEMSEKDEATNCTSNEDNMMESSDVKLEVNPLDVENIPPMPQNGLPCHKDADVLRLENASPIKTGLAMNEDSSFSLLGTGNNSSSHLTAPPPPFNLDSTSSSAKFLLDESSSNANDSQVTMDVN